MSTRDTDKHADGTIESLRTVVHTIKEYALPELPLNEKGQMPFMRAIFESVVAEVEASIARQGDQRLCGLCDHAVTGNGAIVDCRECGQKRQCNYFPDVQERLIRTSTCFSCDHWLAMVRFKDDPATVRVMGKHYMDGGNTSSPSRMNGFGGSVFRVKFHDGRCLETNNLWHQGTIPDHFKERLPDNAIFVWDESTQRERDDG